MKALYEAYRDKAVILVVYIREAHPANSNQTAEDAGWKVIEGTVFHQPKTYEERRKLAETACTFWELPIPALVDTMKPDIGDTYNAFPNRVYLLDTEGKIVYRGVKGPRGVNVHESELELRKLLGITEGEPVTKPPAKRSAPSGRGRLGGRRGSPQSEETADKPEEPPTKVDDSGEKNKTPDADAKDEACPPDDAESKEDVSADKPEAAEPATVDEAN